MTLEDTDRALQRLRDAAERIRANLLELELDPNRRLLDESALEGGTAARWSAASATLTQLWEWHALLDALLERAAALRGARRPRPDQLAELGALLEGPSLAFASTEVPLAQRDLLGTSKATQRCTPDELLARMSGAFDEAKPVVADVGRAWETLGPRLRAARAQLAHCKQLARELDDERGDLEAAEQRLAALGDALARDPLSIADSDVEDVVQSLQAIRRDLDSLSALRGDILRRLARARALSAELQEVAREGRVAHEEVIVKIAAPASLEPLEIGDDVDAQLERIAELAGRAAWREARDALERWTAGVTALLDRARGIVTANRAPIESRNQLRALLEAYQIKARRLGLIEDPRLADIFERAHEGLYTAPTDLAQTGELVRSYQAALTGKPPNREVLL
jgi:hypothetical protein